MGAPTRSTLRTRIRIRIRIRGRTRLVLLVLPVALAGACTTGGPVVTDMDPAPRAEPLPLLGVEQVVGDGEDALLGSALTSPEDPETRVTLTATGTDLRALLVALADAAGVSLVLGPDVEGRVTVHLEEVPAREALERVIAETGLMISRPLERLWGPTVFYVVPVNVNEADAATIRARFGVSEELARFIVRARVPD